MNANRPGAAAPRARRASLRSRGPTSGGAWAVAVAAAVLASLVLPAPPAAADFASGVYGVGTRPNRIVAGDFDGDGRLDLATADSASGTVSATP